MLSSKPLIVTAGEREAGTDCPVCGREVFFGDHVARCRRCGAIHHESCWTCEGQCGSYECSPGKARDFQAGPALTITSGELAAAEPLPTRASFADPADLAPPEKKYNRTAVWAFIIALLGIPLFGLITGIVAIILGCIALVVQTSRHRGLWMGVASIIIGLIDVVGWAFGLYYYLGKDRAFVAIHQAADIDLDALRNLPEHLARPMRSNVIVVSDAGFAGQGMGSGVILKLKNRLAWIVTNRHVIDPDYSDATDDVPKDLSSLPNVSIQTVSELAVPAKIEWVAPYGVDLAILSTRLDPQEIATAHWDAESMPRIGDDVFAIGNPHGLGWTHSAGQLSQIRRQNRGLFSYQVIQSTAALNPGNSGGGLYDGRGRLIGINTLTGDKRVAEGLGFSIAIPALLELLPPDLSLPDQFSETKNDE